MDAEIIDAARMAENYDKFTPEMREILNIFENNVKQDVVGERDKKETDGLTLYSSDGTPANLKLISDPEPTAEPCDTEATTDSQETKTNYSTPWFKSSFLSLKEVGFQGSAPSFSLHHEDSTKDLPVSMEGNVDSSGYISNNSPDNEVDTGPTSSPDPLDMDTSPVNIEGTEQENYVSPPDNFQPDDESESPCSPISPEDILSWVSSMFPELVSIWRSTSATEFYQGGVELLCSYCKKTRSTGFHDGRPMCEWDRQNRAVVCSVCKVRSSRGFYHGLTMCEEDRLFLSLTFSRQIPPPRCTSPPCPPSSGSQCDYCRLSSCLAEPGFRFDMGGASSLGGEMGSRPEVVVKLEPGVRENKRVEGFQPAGPGGVSDTRHISLTSGTSAWPTPNPSPMAYPVNTGNMQAPTLAYRMGSLGPNPLQQVQGQVFRPIRAPMPISRATPYYDGSTLGGRGCGRGLGLLSDPGRQEWIRGQQLKYLHHHLEIYRERMARGQTMTLGREWALLKE